MIKPHEIELQRASLPVPQEALNIAKVGFRDSILADPTASAFVRHGLAAEDVDITDPDFQLEPTLVRGADGTSHIGFRATYVKQHKWMRATLSKPLQVGRLNVQTGDFYTSPSLTEALTDSDMDETSDVAVAEVWQAGLRGMRDELSAISGLIELNFATGTFEISSAENQHVQAVRA